MRLPEKNLSKLKDSRVAKPSENMTSITNSDYILD